MGRPARLPRPLKSKLCAEEGVVVQHADGRPGVADCTPYTIPEAPDKGAYDVVQGLWPQLELTGTNGQVVRMTRKTGQPPPSQEVQRAR